MLVYIYITFIGVAFLSSLIAFRLDFPTHLKLLSLLIGCDLLVELCANFLIIPLHLRSNVPLYNVTMLLEFWTYGYFFRTILDNSWLKKAITYYLILLPVFWIVVVFFVFGISHWNSYFATVGSLFTVCMAIAFYYQLFTAPTLIRLSASPEFWIAAGLIIFYAGNLPYLGMLNFITRNYLELAKKLLLILQVLNIIMYSFFALGYLCSTRTMKLSSR